MTHNPTAYAQWQNARLQAMPEPNLLRLTNAHLIGPFDNTDFRGLRQAYAPEQSIDLAGSYTW